MLAGAGFTRDPPESTAAYTAWANALTDADLTQQAWRECTVIQPTWFMSRATWDAVGGWDECLPPGLMGGGAASPSAASDGGGFLAVRPRRVPREAWEEHAYVALPEDTIFLHRHLAGGGRLVRVPEPLVLYRYSPGSQSWKMPRQLLLAVRVALFEECVLCAPASREAWATFTIWGAGRDGKAFYNALSPAARARVAAFCDVDTNKIGQVYPAPVRPPGGKAKSAPAAAAGGGGGGSGGGASADAASTGDAAGAGAAAAAGVKRPRTDMDDVPPAAAASAVAPPADVPKPIVHFSAARLPIVCCVALGSKGSELMANVATLPGVAIGVNFWYFV